MSNEFNENENYTPAEEIPTPEHQDEVPQTESAPAQNKLNEWIPQVIAFCKKHLIPLCILAVVVIVAIVALSIHNSPSAVAGRVVGNAIDDFAERDEIDYLTSLLSGGSVDVAFKGNVDGADVNAHGKIYLNAEDSEFMLELLQLEAKVQDEKIGLTGSMYLSDDTAYLSNDEILKGTYGLERGSMESGLKSSIFNPESGSAYALDEETYEMLVQFCKIADSDLPEDLEKDVLKVVSRYTDKLSGWIKKYAEFETSKQELDLVDGDKNVRVIYVIITPKTVRNICKELRDYIKDDSKLRDLVIEYYTEFADILGYTLYLGEDFDIREAYDEAIEELDDTLTYYIESMEDEDEDSFVAICMATPKHSSKLLKLWVIGGDDIDDIEDKDEVSELFSLDFGSKGIKKAKQITFNYLGRKIKYSVNDEEKNIVEYKLQIGSEYKVSLKLDTKEDTFKIQYTEYYYNDTSETVSVEGKYTTKSDTATYELKKVKIDGEVLENFDYDLTVTFEKKDSMPSPEKKITSVFELTDEKIEKIMENAEEWASAAN